MCCCVTRDWLAWSNERLAPVERCCQALLKRLLVQALRTQPHTQTRTHTHPCSHTHKLTYTHAHMYTKHIHPNKTHSYKHSYNLAHTNTHIHTTYEHKAYTHTHTHTHTSHIQPPRHSGSKITKLRFKTRDLKIRGESICQ